MSIFIDNSFTPVCQNLDYLNETGIISFIKRFYTGKDKKEIEEFREELKKSNSHSQIQDLIDDINEAIDDVNDFRHNSTLGRFFGHGIGAGAASLALSNPLSGNALLAIGVTAAAVNLWFKNGSAKKALLRHRDELEAVKRDAYKKLEKVKL